MNHKITCSSCYRTIRIEDSTMIPGRHIVTCPFCGVSIKIELEDDGAKKNQPSDDPLKINGQTYSSLPSDCPSKLPTNCIDVRIISIKISSEEIAWIVIQISISVFLVTCALMVIIGFFFLLFKAQS